MSELLFLWKVNEWADLLWYLKKKIKLNSESAASPLWKTCAAILFSTTKTSNPVSQICPTCWLTHVSVFRYIRLKRRSALSVRTDVSVKLYLSLKSLSTSRSGRGSFQAVWFVGVHVCVRACVCVGMEQLMRGVGGNRSRVVKAGKHIPGFLFILCVCAYFYSNEKTKTWLLN